MNAAERFVEWFNTTGREVIDLPLDLECNDSAERYSVECWVDATPDSETTMDDYHEVVELVSSGIVEIGDDGRAYYRVNPVREPFEWKGPRNG